MDVIKHDKFVHTGRVSHCMESSDWGMNWVVLVFLVLSFGFQYYMYFPPSCFGPLKSIVSHDHIQADENCSEVVYRRITRCFMHRCTGAHKEMAGTHL